MSCFNCNWNLFDYVWRVIRYAPVVTSNSSPALPECAKTKTSITQKVEKFLFDSWKSLLFKDQQTWTEKWEDLFDIIMGPCDGVKIFELVGSFIPSIFQQVNNVNNFILYRDDVLAAVKNMSGPQPEKGQKELQVLFIKFGLNLIIECNKTTVDYLDITLN